MTIGTTVRIHTNIKNPNPVNPYLDNSISQGTASGWLCEIATIPNLFEGLSDAEITLFKDNLKKMLPGGKAIITNAHVVGNSTSITVNTATSSTRYKAEALVIAHWADLGIIIPEDNFFTNEKPNAFKVNMNIPKREKVKAHGFPVNGSTLAVTEGTVARFSPIIYAHSNLSLANIEITAAINSGNSGGPIVNNNDEVVGIIHQSIPSTQKAYAIPVFYLRSILQQLFIHKRVLGAFCINVSYQKLENPFQRKQLGLDSQTTLGKGVLITKCKSDPSPLNIGDVVLNIAITGIHQENHFSVNSSGYITLDEHQVPFTTLMHMAPPFGQVVFDIMRNGKIETIYHSLTSTIDTNVVKRCKSEFAQPFTYRHGILFRELHGGYIRAFTSNNQNAPTELYNAYTQNKTKTQDKRSVVFIRILSPEAAGYESFHDAIITHINNKPIIDLHMIRRELQQIDSAKVSQISLRTANSKIDNIILPTIDSHKHEEYCKLYGVKTSDYRAKADSMDPPSKQYERNSQNGWRLFKELATNHITQLSCKSTEEKTNPTHQQLWRLFHFKKKHSSAQDITTTISDAQEQSTAKKQRRTL